MAEEDHSMDMYFEETVAESSENDEIDAVEEGFFMGYLEAADL